MNSNSSSLLLTSKLMIVSISISDCDMDDFLINLGKKVNTFSGFFDGGVNFLFRYFVTDYSMLSTCMNTLNYNCVGEQVGLAIKQFFESEVRDVTLGSY